MNSCGVGIEDMRGPTVKMVDPQESSVTTSTIRVFAKAHQFNINSFPLTPHNYNFFKTNYSFFKSA